MTEIKHHSVLFNTLFDTIAQIVAGITVVAAIAALWLT